MSSESTSTSSTHGEEPSSPPTTTGSTFTCFLRLPVELQVEVWQYAFASNDKPRIACLRVQSAPSAALSHEVLNLGNTDATIGWEILNPMYLAQSDHVSSLLATSDRSRTVALSRAQETLDTTWLRRLGLSGAHINPETDIVGFGHPFDQSADNRFMTSMSLVLGNEFPNIMVAAQLFAAHMTLDLKKGAGNPVIAGLEALRARDPVWNQLFRSSGATPMISPGLPRNIYYFVANPRREPRCEHQSGSFCLHHEHLRIVSSDEALSWAVSYTSASRDEYLLERASRLRRVQQIQGFWSNLGIYCPELSGRTPNVFFVEIKE